MEQKILGFVKTQKLLSAQQNVIIALSGGADSVALLHFMHTNRKQLGLRRLMAAHFEHGLRGEDSLRDAEFVRELCKSLDVELFMQTGDMRSRTRPKGLGEEAWARQLRYDFFESLAAEQEAVVATAHTMSDNAETVLFHACRGSGPRGLAGIPPKRGVFIRPMLAAQRADILEYCERQGLDYCVDATNADVRYARNRIRHEVLPALEQAHPGAQRALWRTAQDMRELNEYLAGQGKSILDEAAAPKGGWFVQKLCEAAQPVLLQALAYLAGRDASRAQLALMEQMLANGSGAVQLDGQRIARIEGDRLVFGEAEHDEQADEEEYELALQAGEMYLPGAGRMLVEVLPASQKDYFGLGDENRCTFVADCDKISKNVVLRTRRQGDSFSPAGRGVTKTLKKWMNEQKIPPARRGSLPLLCEGSKVVWVWGVGFAEGFAPDDNTKMVLCISTEVL